MSEPPPTPPVPPIDPVSPTPPDPPTTRPSRSRPPGGPGSLRRRLRAGAVCLAAIVTVLAAVPPDDGAAADPVARQVNGPAPPDPPGAGPTPETGTATPAPPAPGAAAPNGSTGPDPTGSPPADTPAAVGSPVPSPVRPPGAGRRAPGASYAWPLVPVPDVVTPFRRPTFRFGRGHRGADLAGAAGQAVVAAGDGVVVFAGQVAGRPVVSVDHPDGLRSTYQPVVASVAAGSRVAAGDPLGVLVTGHAGCPGPCLHWGVRRGKVDYLDPLVLVRPPRLRLLPLDGA